MIRQARLEQVPVSWNQLERLARCAPSPRLRGEGWGEGQTPRWTVARAPHPTPLPVKNGEREQTERVARVDLTSSKRALAAALMVFGVVFAAPRPAAADELNYACSVPPLEAKFAIAGGRYDGTV